MTGTKDEVRAAVRASRRARPDAAREQAAEDLAEWMTCAPFRLEYDVVAAAYVPSGTEPGSRQMLDALAGQGVRVLVPVVPPGPPGPLDWARYDTADTLSAARFGLHEPGGDRLGAGAVERASVVFLPAMAASRTGVRLGRGAGYYDRSVGAAVTGPARAELVAVVFDDELFDDLPADPHDVPVDWVLTPGGGFLRCEPGA